MTYKIRLQNVTKIYGSHPHRRALPMLHEGISKDEIFRQTKHVVGLNNVSFDIQPGEIFVVMGLSGSGKSTLIRCVNRLIEVTDGDIFVDDINITQMDKPSLRRVRRERLSMVFQHFGLFPHRTVIENAGYGLKVSGTADKDWRKQALEALEMVGLRDWADHYPHNLSGGMQQRVGLARALATDSDILLMDEAFSALDPLIRREMQDELMTLQANLKKTILFITHDLSEAFRVGDRVAVMRDGAVVQIGTPAEIITEPSDEYVADFMADVDSGRVLTAEFILSPARAVQRSKHTVADALKRLDEMKADHLYVTTDKGIPAGVISRPALRELHDKGARDFSSIVRGEYPQTTLNAFLSSLYTKATRGIPIAVLNEKGVLQGVVYPLHIFNALSISNSNANASSAAAQSAEARPVENINVPLEVN